jgi:putative FmdB family regulatory protein
MPIYEYRCDACGAGHEALRKVSDPALTQCPSCGEERLRKLISRAGFRLAGSGWYETDFKGSDRQRNLAGERQADGDAKPVDKGADAAPAASAAATDKSVTDKPAADKPSANKSNDKGATI